MRLHSNRVRPEPWGCGGLVPLDTPAEQPLPLNSAGFDHKIVRENGFARNRQPAAPPRRRDERVPATACPLFPSLAAGTAGHSNRVALFSCQGFLAWGLSALCALFPPGEPELLPAPSPYSPTRIPLRITPPLSRFFDSPLTLLLHATDGYAISSTTCAVRRNICHLII